jgi:hypothetical protein
MRNLRKAAAYVLIWLLFGTAALYSQNGPQFPLGAIFDAAAYSRLPRKAALASRAYDGERLFPGLRLPEYQAR